MKRDIQARNRIGPERLLSSESGSRGSGSRKARTKRIVKIIAGFFLGQGALQLVNLLASLFLVHTLSVESYAQFGLAFGFQATVAALMDFGFANTVIPLVGEQAENRAVVGRYVRAAKHLRDRSFLFLAPFAALAFFAVVYRHHWSWSVQLLLLLSVLISLYSGGQVSYYSAPLFLYRRLREFYVPQTISGVGRLAGYLVLHAVKGLNAWTAAGLSACNVTVNGSLLGKESRKLLDWPEHDDPVADREVLKYILPAAPAIIFAAFQSQISLFLISLFGKTVNIAQVAALGRLGQLLAVFTLFNGVVIEPYMARLNRDRVLSAYLRFIVLAIACCIPVVAFAFIFPQPFLWLLGSRYQDLGSLVGWVVLSSCMNYVAGLAWIMNRARKWVFWSGSVLEVVLLLVVQTAFVAYVGVRNTRSAVLFSVASSICYIIAHGYAGVYGFWQDRPFYRLRKNL